MHPQTRDLAIVGGGPAGLAAALVAGRSRLSTVLVNAEAPRNAVTKESHGFLTRDGAHPREMLAAAKDQLQRYASVEYRKDAAVAVEREGEAFRIRLASGGSFLAARVLLAFGYRDDVDALGLPGLAEVYGRSVFPCPFCDAFEHAGGRLAVFGGAGVEVYAALVRQWGDDVAVFTNGRALEAAAREALQRNGVPLDESRVLGLDAKDGRLVGVRTERGVLARDAGFLWGPTGAPAASFADDLGVPRAAHPLGAVTYEADEVGRTSVPGVYVVGDLRTGFSKLLHAASEGARCVEGIVHERAKERWR